MIDNIEEIVKKITNDKKFRKDVLNGIANKVGNFEPLTNWKEDITQTILKAKSQKKEQVLAEMEKWLVEHFEPQVKAWKKGAFEEVNRFVRDRVQSAVGEVVKEEINNIVKEQIKTLIKERLEETRRSMVNILEENMRAEVKAWVRARFKELRIGDTLEGLGKVGLVRNAFNDALIGTIRRVNKNKDTKLSERLHKIADEYDKHSTGLWEDEGPYED